VASAGRSLTGATWDRLDGRFRRFPLGRRKVGHVALTGEPLGIRDLEADAPWLVDRDWAADEGIRGFEGQPLSYRGETLGVLGVFTRDPWEDEELEWLRVIADHAATAIVNARAFEEIQRLRELAEQEKVYLREELRDVQAFGSIVGTSDALKQVLQQVEMVAPTDANVLILGESGTGKELIAHEIHARSPRSDKAMVRVNCPSIPKDLFESEFFGHTKGAFTGALKQRAGRFELADGGTLFLDEVSEIPVELQSKLLRVLQEGQFERVGSERTVEVDVRIVAATNRDLREAIEVGAFREDLYYRLNVFPISLAPLRERKDDIPLLVAHFLELVARDLNLPVPDVTMTDIEELQNYDWPGNVRELRNVIERAVVASRLGTLRFDVPKADAAAVAQGSAATGTPAAGGVLTDDEVRRIERDNTLAALKRSDWKVYGEGGAAELLGIKPTTLKSRMQKMGLQRRGSEATAAAEDEPMRRAARGNSLGDVVKEHILRVLEHNDGNKSKTARDLGIDPKTLYKRLREYGILPPSE
jgi:transcriptional regulator with GAF, ATPase, and Fis domain